MRDESTVRLCSVCTGDTVLPLRLTLEQKEKTPLPSQNFERLIVGRIQCMCQPAYDQYTRVIYDPFGIYLCKDRYVCIVGAHIDVPGKRSRASQASTSKI